MGVILETWSTKKLIAFGIFLLLVLATFFLVGGLITPHPTSAMNYMAHICAAPNMSSRAFYDPWRCDKLQNIKEAWTRKIPAERIVFSLVYPHPGLAMSRYHQFIAASVNPHIEHSPDPDKPKYGPLSGKKDEYPVLTFDAKLAYQDENDTNWKQMAEAIEDRELKCELHSISDENSYYTCEDIPFFEIGSVYHPYYLVNIRLPVGGKNREIGSLTEMHFVEIHQNGGFTRNWFIMKTVVAVINALLMIWYTKRVMAMGRKVILLEKALFALGITAFFLNFPVEWMTLWVDMPYMLLFTDVRQGIFYGMMLCFWIIFTGEHLLEQSERNRLGVYWKQIGAIALGCASLLVFDMCERGYQLHNPFYTIWATKTGTQLAQAFIICAAISACVYFLFLLFMVFRVFKNIHSKRTSITSLSRARRLHYQGLIYRFEFLMVVSVLCAGMTVVFFIISNVNEVEWKFADEESRVEISSALFFGVYGLWNVYVFAVIFLYAPTTAVPEDTEDESGDRLEMHSRHAQYTSENPLTEEREHVIYSMAGKVSQD